MLPILLNQFGFDRNGFRLLLLAPIRRSDLIIGKNLSYAPWFFLVGITALAVFQVFEKQSVGILLASLIQLKSMYLILCLVGNLFSILTPTRIEATPMSVRRNSTQYFTVQIVVIMCIPIILLPLLIPILAVQFVKMRFEINNVDTIYLIVACVMLCIITLVYRMILLQQEKLLQRNEKSILKNLEC